jgi:prefoldin subunit 5
MSMALQGNWRKELLYEFKNCYEFYQIFQRRIDKYDKEIEQLLKSITTLVSTIVKQRLSELTQNASEKPGKLQPH